MDEAKYIEIYKNVRVLRDAILKSNGLVIKLMSHPDATANAIMEMHSKMVKNRSQYRKIHASLVKLAGAKKRYRYDPVDLKL